MEGQNSQILFAYLKNILNDSDKNEMDIEALARLSKNISEEEPMLHEVAQEMVSFLQQLKKREDDLRQKAEEVGKYMEVIQSYNDLLTELTRMRDEWIMVVKADDKSILYCNKRSGKFHTEEGSCDFCQHRLEFQHHLLDWEPSECERVWEAEDGCGQCFLILSFSIPWKDGLVYAHVVANVTEEKQRTRQLTDKAYSDPGTGIFNRRYAEEQLEHMLKKRMPHTFCYLDLDGLKYVNDKFGHMEGDAYISNFVSVVKTRIRNTDIFARIGGDEFVIIFMDCPKHAAEEKLGTALEMFIRENQKEYPVSFSYGVLAVTGKEQDLTREKLLKQADEAMYLCKQENKRKYHQHKDWKDSRLENAE